MNGLNGANGRDGSDGLNCWDLNGDHVDDPVEDINGDGVHDATDCHPSRISVTLGVQRLYYGLPDAEYSSENSLTIPAGNVVINNRDYTNSGSVGWSFANLVGPGGLDEGSEVEQAWYYLYAIPGQDNEFSSIASTEPPTWSGGNGPLGYTEHVYLASFYNESSGIRAFVKRGVYYEYHSEAQIYYVESLDAAANEWRAFSVQDGVPPATAKRTTLTMWQDDDYPDDGNFYRVRFVGSSGIGHVRLASQHTEGSEVNANTWDTLVPNSLSFEWSPRDPNPQLDLAVLVNGYEE